MGGMNEYLLCSLVVRAAGKIRSVALNLPPDSYSQHYAQVNYLSEKTARSAELWPAGTNTKLCHWVGTAPEIVNIKFSKRGRLIDSARHRS